VWDTDGDIQDDNPACLLEVHLLPTTWCCPCLGFRHHNVSVSEGPDADPYWPKQGSGKKGNRPLD